MAVEDEMEAATPAAQKPVEQEASKLDPKTFDLAKWIEGVEPIEHAVKIYARGSLLAELDIIKGELDNAKLAKNYALVKELGDRAAEIVAALEESALTVKVVAWSQDKIDAFTKPLKDAGITVFTIGVGSLDPSADLLDQVDAALLTECASPGGFRHDPSAEQLDAIYQSAETGREVRL